ncbi:MAG TPA: phage portal protein [Dehalococcoidia bacterium]|nr:phage portal protein [Dehalococcoidia bacterium]
MGLLSSVHESRATKITGGKLANPPLWMREFFGWLSGTTAAGVSVDEESALRYSALFACVRILAEDLGSLPLHLYEELEPRGKQKAKDHPLYEKLHDAPNPEISSMQWRETGQLHLGLWGNSYHEIEWNGAGEVEALWPITPKRVKVERKDRTGPLQYRIQLEEGQEKVLRREQVLHIPGLSLNGVTGLSPIALMRESIALGLAAEEFGARFFGNDARPGILLKHPGHLSDQGQKNLRASFEGNHQGLSKRWRLAILEEGMDVAEVGLPPEDAQFLETRKFQRSEIAGAYRMPLHMIGDLERATFSNIEQQSLEYVVRTLRPWLVRWEQAIALQLLLPAERQRFFARFNVEGLLRGDVESRSKWYAAGRQWGWFNVDDIREFEDMNPLPDGKGQTYLMPLNMGPAPQTREEWREWRELQLALLRADGGKDGDNGGEAGSYSPALNGNQR